MLSFCYFTKRVLFDECLGWKLEIECGEKNSVNALNLLILSDFIGNSHLYYIVDIHDACMVLYINFLENYEISIKYFLEH